MAEKFLMIAGGEIDIPFAEDYVETHPFDKIVCADAGLEAASALHLSVDYVMGDFDSVSGELLEKYRDKNISESRGVQFVQYPPEKDATDLHLALDWVMERQPEEIVILGATGGRLDHFLANVNILMKPMSQGIPAYIVDRHNKLYLLNHGREIRREEMHGKYISFLPLTERVRKVSLRGFRYELEGQDMMFGDSLGVSNEMAEGCQTARVDFTQGILVVVESRD